MMLVVLLVSMSTLACSLDTARALSTIYIRADGSVDPATAPIQRNGDVFTLTGNIASDTDGIVIERNNTVLDGAGYTLQGTSAPSSTGVYLSGIASATIKNMRVKAFGFGIYFYNSINNNICENEVTDNEYGILLDTYSTGTKISGNKVANNIYGVNCIGYSDENIIGGNTITTNLAGIWIVGSSSTNISENIITGNNQYGIRLESSSNNAIYHNNFMNNPNQAYTYDSTSDWDNGYPSGGNYWSDYTGNDIYSGPYQNEAGSDGIGDIPYVVDANNQDRYPLMKTCDIGIQRVTTSKAVVGQGYKVSINVEIVDYGINSENFNLTTYVNTISIATQTVTLTSVSSTTITFAWNTSGFAKGSYTVSAYAWPVPGETHTADNNFTDGTVYVGIPGDVNADRKVDMKDIGIICLAYGSYPGHPKWNPNADINGDGKVDMRDIGITCLNYGKTGP
jgi:parallel beta-helix repeat protein